jgi:hypothetical protein
LRVGGNVRRVAERERSMYIYTVVVITKQVTVSVARIPYGESPHLSSSLSQCTDLRIFRIKQVQIHVVAIILGQPVSFAKTTEFVVIQKRCTRRPGSGQPCIQLSFIITRDHPLVAFDKSVELLSDYCYSQTRFLIISKSRMSQEAEIYRRLNDKPR